MVASKFKKVGETASHNIYEHSDGHIIHECKGTPRKMADGGDVSALAAQDSSAPSFLQSMFGTPQAAPQQAPMTPMAPQAPTMGDVPDPAAAQEDPLGLGKLKDDYTQSMGEAEVSMRNQGQDKAAELMAQEPAMAKQAKQMEASRVQGQQELAKNSNEYSEFVKAVQAEHINPEHYMETRGSRKAILQGIGAFISGAGMSMHNMSGTNPVLDMIKMHITNDIAAQEANLGTKKSLLEANLRQFGNIKAAREMTQAQILGATAAQMQSLGSKSNQDLVKDQANQGAALLHAEAQQKIQGLTQQQLLMKQAFGNDGEVNGAVLNMLNPEMAKYQESHTIPGTQGHAKAPVPEAVRAKSGAYLEYKQKLAQLAKFASQNSGTLFNRSKVAEGEVLRGNAIDALRRASEGGVPREGEMKFLNSLLPSPTGYAGDWFSSPAYKRAAQSADIGHQSILQPYGLKLKPINFGK